MRLVPGPDTTGRVVLPLAERKRVSGWTYAKALAIAAPGD